MCGIAGLVRLDGRTPDMAALARMTDAMAHRGPDARGLLAARPSPVWPAAHAAFGHRRLSILDLSSAGAQPMHDAAPQGGMLTFNGEIYNFRQLREELLRETGIPFASRSDTEVLLRGLLRHGPDFLHRCNGMFAFAFWDARKGTLWLGRDRFGKKPLYYHAGQHFLAFASELSALLQCPDIPRALNMEGLSRYLLHEYVPAPHSMVAGVHKLAPGSWLRLDAQGLEVRRWWEPVIGKTTDGTELDPHEPEDRVAARVRDAFIRAVERRLVSDVPLGVFLSGGVDSSCVVAAMRHCMEADRIRTFAIGFHEPSFDESSFARDVARHCGTRHEERILAAADLPALLPEALACLDEPLADASLLPTWLLSRFTREHVTVALGGDGGDELFAGYDPFLALTPAQWATRLPSPVLRPLLQAARHLPALLPASEKNMSLGFRLSQTLRGLEYPLAQRNQVWLGAFTPREQTALLTQEALFALHDFDPLAALGTQTPYRHPVDATLDFYQRWYLPGDILTKVDRASMAASLEARAPFLDAEFAALVNALPRRYKLRGLTRKWLLKRLFAAELPSAVVSRPKKGFGIPLTAWLKGPLLAPLREALDPNRLQRQGLFRPKVVQHMLEEHAAGKADHRKPLWTLYCFQVWRERFLGD